MKISLKWLNDHVDILDYATRADELARVLTDAGLEVEATENRAESFRHVVVGHILKLERHPNADRLTVCQLDVGDGTPRQIVCGATNHRAGDKVVVTLPGAVLPGDFAIKKSKIRDVESMGMLASESELGLVDKAEGILILPADAPVGMPFAEYRGLDDVVFELKITPNRADCLSHLGLARELSCLLERPLKAPAIDLNLDHAVNTHARVKLEVRDTRACGRYAGRVIDGVRVGPSPAWLKVRLESVGMKSINNVVDVTNYVMMDLGQPMHAFDLNSLGGGTVIVAPAVAGETFVTLDGTKLTLTGDELTIRDDHHAVALAGAIGGQDSGVGEQTKAIFLESAHFAMDSVRRTARRFGLQTDSAYRFSRGVDPSNVKGALDRASALLAEMAGGRVAADAWDQNPRPRQPPQIMVTAAYVTERLGYEVTTAELSEALRRIGARVESDRDQLKVTAPEFRYDLEQPADLVEEFGRLKGYDTIPETLPPLTGAPLSIDPGFGFEQRVNQAARGAGLSQAVNYGFVNAAAQAEFSGDPAAWVAAGLNIATEPVRLKNPLSEDLNVMRTSLLSGLIKNALLNARHGAADGRLFETGFTFRRAGAGFAQDPRLGVVAWGSPTGLWDKDQSEARVFFDLKARVVQILEKLQITSAQFNLPKDAIGPVHPGQAAVIFVEGRNVGFIGSLHPRVIAREKLRGGWAVAELNLEALGRGQPRPIKFKSIAKFPVVERDLAFVLPNTTAAVEVEREIRRSAGPVLQSVRVFDVFTGGSLPADHASVAFRMVYQDPKETLDEARLTKLQDVITSNVERKLGIKVRA